MTTLCTSPKPSVHALNGVTKICLAATTGCFLVGGLFLLADAVVPIGPRGVALIAVGCFFLTHGIYELAKQRFSRDEKKSAADSWNESTDQTAAQR